MDMIKRMQVNRDLVLGRRERTKRAKEAYQESDATYRRTLNLDSKLSEAEQAELLISIRNKKKAENSSYRRKSILVTILLILTLAMVFKFLITE